MAHAQKPDFVFRRNGRVHLNRQGASVQSTTGSRGVRSSGSNAGYTTFRGSVKSTGYTLHSPVSPSLPLPYVTVCHHVSTGLYVGITLALRMNSLPPYSGENKPQRRSVRIFGIVNQDKSAERVNWKQKHWLRENADYFNLSACST